MSVPSNDPPQTHECFDERALSRPVRTEENVRLSGVDAQIHSFEHFVSCDFDV